MSQSNNSNSQHHVNNVKSKSLKPVQSTQERQNSLSATNEYAFNITDKTTTSTRSRAQNNATRSSLPRNNNIPNIHGFGETRSRRNNIDSSSNMTRYVHRTLSEPTTEALAQRRARNPTNNNNNHFLMTHPNLEEYTQNYPFWYRIVSIDVNSAETDEPLSTTQPQKFQRTLDGRRSIAGVIDSQPDVGWYRRVNRDIFESQKSVSSSRSERLERRRERQHPTPPSSSFQAHLNNSRSESESSVNNTYRGRSQTEPIASNISSNESERYQSDNVIPPALQCQHQNFNSNQPPAASILSNSERSVSQDTSFVSLLNVTNYSNRGQVFIDLDEIDSDTDDQVNSSHEVNRNSVTHAIETTPNNPPTNSSGIDEPETLEIIIRSRNNADYRFLITNPDIIRMHKVLQNHILNSENTSSSNSSILYQQVNHYMRVLRNTMLLTDSNTSSISSRMSTSVPRSLTIDQSFYPLMDTSQMPPVTIINRIQNGIYNLLFKNIIHTY